MRYLDELYVIYNSFCAVNENVHTRITETLVLNKRCTEACCDRHTRGNKSIQARMQDNSSIFTKIGVVWERIRSEEAWQIAKIAVSQVMFTSCAVAHFEVLKNKYIRNGEWKAIFNGNIVLRRL